MSAPAAHLTRWLPSANDAHFAPVPLALAFHHRAEHSPALTTDRAGEAGSHLAGQGITSYDARHEAKTSTGRGTHTEVDGDVERGYREDVWRQCVRCFGAQAKTWRSVPDGGKSLLPVQSGGASRALPQGLISQGRPIEILHEVSGGQEQGIPRQAQAEVPRLREVEIRKQSRVGAEKGERELPDEQGQVLAEQPETEVWGRCRLVRTATGGTARSVRHLSPERESHCKGAPIRRSRPLDGCCSWALVCKLQLSVGAREGQVGPARERENVSCGIIPAFAVIELNGEADHVHVVVRYPPKLSISKIVNSLKGVSSRRYREAGHRMPSKRSLWSPSYFASSVGGAPIEVLRQYVQNQEAGLKAVVSDQGEIR
jgi:putative transposase